MISIQPGEYLSFVNKILPQLKQFGILWVWDGTQDSKGKGFVLVGIQMQNRQSINFDQSTNFAISSKSSNQRILIFCLQLLKVKWQSILHPKCLIACSLAHSSKCGQWFQLNYLVIILKSRNLKQFVTRASGVLDGMMFGMLAGRKPEIGHTLGLLQFMAEFTLGKILIIVHKFITQSSKLLYLIKNY